MCNAHLFVLTLHAAPAIDDESLHLGTRRPGHIGGRCLRQGRKSIPQPDRILDIAFQIAARFPFGRERRYPGQVGGDPLIQIMEPSDLVDTQAVVVCLVDRAETGLEFVPIRSLCLNESFEIDNHEDTRQPAERPRAGRLQELFRFDVHP